MKNKTPKDDFKQFQSTADKIGRGSVLPVAYDTAWLARIPTFPDCSKPAFPGALDWLRIHQLEAGDWGTQEPKSAYGNTLSTFAAILAFAQWNNSSDQQFIKRGVQALEKLAPLLQNETHETIGFELLLPVFLRECEIRGINIPQAMRFYYQQYEEMYDEKNKLINAYQEKYGNDKPASWWFSLEMLGGASLTNKDIHLEVREEMLSPYGSVAASPAATAYLLAAMRFRGKDLPRAYEYLSDLAFFDNEKNALPDVFPIDEFELAFSANYLLDAGVPLENNVLKDIIKKLALKWEQRKQQGIGYSSHFFVDPDCSANCITALQMAGYKNLSADILLKFFNGSHIETYQGERSPSVSANLHVLRALRLLKPTMEINAAIKSIASWLEQQAQTSGPIFRDKWHFSPIYPISRAVFALEGLNDELAQRCVSWLCERQLADGGFGAFGYSTAEESAFASLALVFWLNRKNAGFSTVLTRANDFLVNISKNSQDALWIGKVLYCPQLVIECVIAAARYALSSNGVIHSRQLLAIASPYEIKEIPAVARHNKEWAINMALCEPNAKLLKANLAAGSASALRHVSEEALALYTDYSLLLLVLDDIVDEAWPSLGSKEELVQVFTEFMAILKSDSPLHTNKSSDSNFPKYSAVSTALKDIRTRLLKFNSNIDYFVASMRQLFSFFVQEFESRQTKLKLSLEDYLNLRIVVGGMDTAAELAYLLKGMNLNVEERNNSKFIAAKRHAYQALIIINDVLSLNKDSNQSYDNNYVLIIKTERACALQQALTLSLQAYNQEVECFLKIKYEFENSQSKSINHALCVVAEQVQAHTDWAMRSARYQS